MKFIERLRGPIVDGEITTSVRIWRRPRVRVGGRYALGDGHVVVDALSEIELDDVTPRIARESGFAGVAELLKTAKHGPGERVFLVRFHYEPAKT